MDIEFARHLGKDASRIEKILWSTFRNRNFHGLKFRRQQPIGPFVVDFICFEKKFILELDGPHHEQQKDYDRRRDDWLQREGYRVFRVNNDNFFMNEGMVMKKIDEALFSPLPVGERAG